MTLRFVRRRVRAGFAVHPTALISLVAGYLSACQGSTPIGQYGPYSPESMHLVLATETLTVYRMKHWTFTDGSAPALQLEYANSLGMSDTNALRRKAVEIWPAFAPYVEDRALESAIITATILRKRSFGVFATTDNQYFGVIAFRDSLRQWHLEGDTARLPDPDWAGGPRLIDASGAAVPFLQTKESTTIGTSSISTASHPEPDPGYPPLLVQPVSQNYDVRCGGNPLYPPPPDLELLNAFTVPRLTPNNLAAAFTFPPVRSSARSIIRRFTSGSPRRT